VEASPAEICDASKFEEIDSAGISSVVGKIEGSVFEKACEEVYDIGDIELGFIGLNRFFIFMVKSLPQQLLLSMSRHIQRHTIELLVF
jgi:hypothetical protein